MKPEIIVAGLGNPGNKYKGTRHNIGFMVLSELAERGCSDKPQKKFHADILLGKVANKNVLFLCPTTYMNLSGTAVAEAARFFKLDPEQILVVCDDADLPVGKLRIRAHGGSGGQKGLKDIIQKLGTENFPRIRVGIGRPPEKVDMADYVLSTFAKSEKTEIEWAIKSAADAVEHWLLQGIDSAMNRFNS
ncbi:MAG: aminoacyl-tRNA hydrolase [Planctomycetia bacterium]|nr:aminoacyl-tRNA hydrolase [Planctomycetia bacterium]